MYTESKLCCLSVEMSVSAVTFSRWLMQTKQEYIMSKQFLRSATSVGANIHEAQYASSKADFSNKLQIALKEASETEYWLIVLSRTGLTNEVATSIQNQCSSLMRMLTAAINTAKKSED